MQNDDEFDAEFGETIKDWHWCNQRGIPFATGPVEELFHLRRLKAEVEAKIREKEAWLRGGGFHLDVEGSRYAARISENGTVIVVDKSQGICG